MRCRCILVTDYSQLSHSARRGDSAGRNGLETRCGDKMGLTRHLFLFSTRLRQYRLLAPKAAYATKEFHRPTRRTLGFFIWVLSG